MNENVKKFLEKLSADEELQAKLSQVRDPDEAYALASSVQDGFTKEEFIEDMTKIKEALDENLSDEDLAKSAGGIDEHDVVNSVLVSVSVVTVITQIATAAI